ncbi:MAG: acetolactate synthase small subunit [Candidatus Roizmanbacteria bacterium]
MLYTILVFSENKPGVLYRIADLFLRRRINIESLTVSEVGDNKLSRFTITVKAEGALVEKIVKQIYRIIEVVKVIDAVDSQLIFNEVALIKVSTNSPQKRKEVNEIVKLSGAKIIHFTKTDATISLAGNPEDIDSLKDVCSSYGVKEFVRSGRIALVKGMMADRKNVLSMAK